MNTDQALEEVGERFSVTRERIRQIEAGQRQPQVAGDDRRQEVKALRKLKHPSRSRKMRSFLDQ